MVKINQGWGAVAGAGAAWEKNQEPHVYVLLESEPKPLGKKVAGAAPN